MIKRTTVETTYEYDKDGNVVRKTVSEVTEEDTNTYWPHYTVPTQNNETHTCAGNITW